MKKTLLICAIIAALLVVAGGTVAFFTDSEEGYGVVASGELSILQHEYDEYAGPGSAANKPYTQNQVIYPADSISKIVTVENIGSLTAYVRTFVAVPTAGNGMTLAALNPGTDENWVWSDPITNVNIDGSMYDIFCASYTAPLAARETTPPCLMGYTVSPNVSQNGTEYVYRDGTAIIPIGQSNSFNILVATEASQSIVFKNATEAMQATYGTVPNHHPWETVVFAASQAELDTAIANAATNYNTRIGLRKGTYTLPETLPNGIRIFAMDLDVEITNTTLSGYDIEIDGITFPNALSFTGHGDFESVSFQNGWIINPTTGDCFVDSCTFASHEIGNGKYRVIIQP